MSTSPDDQMVTLLSEWLARHIDNAQLLRRLEAVGLDGLAPGQTEAVEELLGELRNAAPTDRGHLEMVLRETFEALALGD